MGPFAEEGEVALGVGVDVGVAIAAVRDGEEVVVALTRMRTGPWWNQM